MGDVIFTNKNRFPYIINQSGFLINIISDKKLIIIVFSWCTN